MKSATEGVHARADHGGGINVQRSSVARGKAFQRYGFAIEFGSTIAPDSGASRPGWTGPSPVTTRELAVVAKGGWA